MFSKIFIERPRFAIVISIVLIIAGAISLFSLPISLYPEIAPPEIVVSALYPGASAEVVANSVGIPMEEEINGIEDMLYMNSSSENSGSYSLTVTFKVGVDPDMAQVKVQNRIQQATSKLPEEVQRQGVRVKSRSADTLGFINIASPNGTHDTMFLSNYVENNMKNNLSRLDGVGEVSVYAAKLSMRVWLDADKITSLNLPIEKIVAAIRSQNYLPSLGKVGATPGDGNQQMVYTLQTLGRINEVEEFKKIIIRRADEGGLLHLDDVARVEVGSEDYNTFSELDGSPSVAISISLLSGANALEAISAVKAELKRLEQFYPEDFKAIIAYDSTKYIQASIDEVVLTLFLTFVLVFWVCYMFLQDWRATLIPILTIPVSLFATFAVLQMMGYSINLLTLFGLVLAIGLVVDDAIVVVERVLYLMEKENLSPKDAAIKAMEQVSGAVVATTLVLLAIFVPVGFMGGITGKIYQQFAVSISCAVLFSSLNALTLSPALCATMLRPLKPFTSGPMFWFNNIVNKSRDKYVSVVAIMARKVSVIALILLLLVTMVWGLLSVSSTSFIPGEDQGVVFLDFQLPEGASQERTKKLLDETYSFIKDEVGVDHYMNVAGASFMGGGGENVALGIAILAPWSERDENLHSSKILGRLRAKLSSIPNAQINLFEPPAIPGLGKSGGMDLRLQSLDGMDSHKLDAVLQSFLMKTNQSPAIQYAFSSYTAKTPHVFVDVDRTKAESMDVAVSSIFGGLQNYMGSSYVNDINFGTQVNKVVIQSDWKHRKDIDSINNIYVANANNKMVPLGSMVSLKKVLAPRTIDRYNQYPSAKVTAMQNPDVSTGAAMATMEELATSLPKGYSYQWSGLSFQEKSNSGQISYLIALAVVFAYLFLVAQYESWSTPLPVLSSITVAIIGALGGLFVMELPLSIYSQLGLILLVGLASKNAILIVEFAKEERERGTSVVKSALVGTRERYRAVLMTAFTFILGMLPMIVATGAGASSRLAIGVPVFYGMLLGTALGLIIIPLLYVLFQNMREKTNNYFKSK